jgi:aminoacrylate hydrolase
MSARRDFTVTTPDGAVIHASVEGRGRPLLLVSGLGGTAGFWSASLPALAERFQVIRFDQRGIGASSRGEAACGVALLAQDALAVLDGAEAETCILVGHSTGGCIGQSMAHRAPGRLAGLVLSATWLRPSRYMAGLFGTRRAILDQNPEAYAATATLLAYPPAWLEENWSRYEDAIARAPASDAARRVVRERIDALLAFDGRDWVGALTMPTFVLGAGDDMIVPAFLQRELAAALPAAHLSILDDGGHFFPISRPETFTEAVCAWAGDIRR